MKILIIEDERHAQQELKRLLGVIDSSIEVLTCIDTVKESVEWLSVQQPELIFMDIQLADGSSFDIFSKVTVKAPVIFTTAYDEFAIRAFKVNSIDYLLKPLEEKTLQEALEKYNKYYLQKTTVDLPLSDEIIKKLMNSIHKSVFKTRFMVSVGDKIKHVEVHDIAYFKAEGNTVFVINKDSSKYVISYSLDELDDLLDPVQFFRLNRSFLGNISAIKDVRKYFNSRLKIYLNPAAEEEILVSRIKVIHFLKWMDH